MTSATRPEIDPPVGPPPTELLTEDLWVGDGAEAQPGVTVSTHYSGVSWSTGEEFDSSWNRMSPLDFPLGRGMVIAGWEQGLVGMKVGGRRRITIPPHLGYGERGAPGAIAPNETLIFVVDLVGIS